MSPRRPPAAGPVRREEGTVRLIGGDWRGTRLGVPGVAGLRPTADRVRETLFNWLMPVLPGARVLDLFAGTGALGLEAVSRGAVSAVLVERDAALAAALRATVSRLGAQDRVSVEQGDATAWLARQPAGTFDIAFVDPPFSGGLWDAVLAELPARMRGGGWIYVEAPNEAPLALPAGWLTHREGRTRDVHYRLLRGPADRLVGEPTGA